MNLSERSVLIVCFQCKQAKADLRPLAFSGHICLDCIDRKCTNALVVFDLQQKQRRAEQQNSPQNHKQRLNQTNSASKSEKQVPTQNAKCNGSSQPCLCATPHKNKRHCEQSNEAIAAAAECAPFSALHPVSLAEANVTTAASSISIGVKLLRIKHELATFAHDVAQWERRLGHRLDQVRFEMEHAHRYQTHWTDQLRRRYVASVDAYEATTASRQLSPARHRTAAVIATWCQSNLHYIGELIASIRRCRHEDIAHHRHHHHQQQQQQQQQQHQQQLQVAGLTMLVHKFDYYLRANLVVLYLGLFESRLVHFKRPLVQPLRSDDEFGSWRFEQSVQALPDPTSLAARFSTGSSRLRGGNALFCADDTNAASQAKAIAIAIATAAAAAANEHCNDQVQMQDIHSLSSRLNRNRDCFVTVYSQQQQQQQQHQQQQQEPMVGCTLRLFNEYGRLIGNELLIQQKVVHLVRTNADSALLICYTNNNVDQSVNMKATTTTVTTATTTTQPQQQSVRLIELASFDNELKPVRTKSVHALMDTTHSSITPLDMFVDARRVYLAAHRQADNVCAIFVFGLQTLELLDTIRLEQVALLGAEQRLMLGSVRMFVRDTRIYVKRKLLFGTRVDVLDTVSHKQIKRVHLLDCFDYFYIDASDDGAHTNQDDATNPLAAVLTLLPKMVYLCGGKFVTYDLNTESILFLNNLRSECASGGGEHFCLNKHGQLVTLLF